MSELLVIETPELESIEKSKASKIKATFEPMTKMLAEFEEVYSEIITEAEKEITKDVTIKAKRLRLDIGKVRIKTEDLRKKEKEEYLRAGKAIDGVSNILKWAVTDKENKLKEIENHFELIELKKLETLQSERVEQLSPYVDDAHERDLSGMEQDVWEAYLATKKKEVQDRIAAEKLAEEERIAKEKAEEVERKRIAAENENLKKEAAEREKQAKIEEEKRAKVETDRIAKEEADRKIREEKERKEREAHEAELKVARDEKERVEKEAQEKREKLEAELKAKEEAEQQQKQDEEKRVQDELNKGDSEKVKDLINDLSDLKTKYAFKSAKNQKMYGDVSGLIDKVLNYIS